METSFLSIKEVAYHVGVKDESHFVRDFKKAYGAAPTPYRMQFNVRQGNGIASEKKPVAGARTTHQPRRAADSANSTT